MMTEPSIFPRLAVVSDVAVERTAAGSLLLYRLFEGYPPARLLAVDAGGPSWKGAQRLGGVRYESVPYRIPRLIRNRFNPAWPLVMSAWIRTYSQAVIAHLQPFTPHGIITVPAHYLWIAAAAAAAHMRIPLYLMLHDDWPSYQTLRRPGRIHDAVRWGCRQILGRVYRQAQARFCVSPGMRDHCQTWFQADGVVLYPSRGEDSAEPRVRVRDHRAGPPVLAFCGHIHQDGALSLLQSAARVLEGMGGHLDLYTPHPQERLQEFALHPPTVRRIGFFPAHEMAERLGVTADALLLPASFEPREHVDVATLFPSKLTDYTATGLPIIIWGPPSSSAARWSASNPGAAVLLTTVDPEPLRATLQRIVTDATYARALAQCGMEAGNRDFALDPICDLFFKTLGASGWPDDASSSRARMGVAAKVHDEHYRP